MATQTLSNVFGKASDEAYVEYFLFPETSVQNDLGKLQEFLVQVNIAAVSIIGDYLWQKGSFQLKLDEAGRYFYGRLHYDINVEDEWFTVHILQHLTEKLPGLVIRVVDQDGEFLLIESSEHLPDWAESDETCQERVYIYNGKIHLIGEFEVNGKMEASLKEPMEVSQALDLIRKYPEQTIADSMIQEVIQARIGKYPGKMLKNFHHVNVFLPPKVAMMLHFRPVLVSAAVRAFHEKDSIDMKTARLMPNFSPEKIVKSRVRFTRTLYSMLASEDYYPDVKVHWKFPLPMSPEFKPHSLGAKLTLGFEILLARGGKPNVGTGSASDTFQSSPAWDRYEQKLTEYNYYHGLIEGSREYTKLQERAKSYFQSSVESEMDASVDDQAILQVQSLMMRDAGDCISMEDVHLLDDDDSWMEMNVEDLESLLAAQFKSKISDQKLDQIPEKLKEFMTQMSDFTGVELPTDGSDHEVSGDEDCGLDPIDFRADDFVSAMDKLLLELGKPAEDFALSDPSSEEEVNVKMKELEKKYNVGGKGRGGGDAKMVALMGAMDEELGATEVGKTFHSSAPRTKARPKKKSKPDQGSSSSGGATSTPTYEPVDIDMNALTNILESFQSQEDPSGPSANLLRNVGFDMSTAAHKK